MIVVDGATHSQKDGVGNYRYTCVYHLDYLDTFQPLGYFYSAVRWSRVQSGSVGSLVKLASKSIIKKCGIILNLVSACRCEPPGPVLDALNLVKMNKNYLIFKYDQT